MEDQLKCAELLSFKEMARRTLIVHLLSDSDILASIMRGRGLIQGPPIEDKIKDKILKLGLPKLLMELMVEAVRPICSHISEWQYFHENTFKFSCLKIVKHDSAKLHFTAAGTIDDRRMAEELVRCNSIDMVQRYRIACSYWLKDHIPALWVELSEKDQQYFKKNSVLQGLEFSWPYIFNGREANLDWFLRSSGRNLTSFNQWAFEHSVKMRYKVTAEYFCKKLTHEEREASVMRTARIAFRHGAYDREERLYDTFFYLLSLMTPQQKMEIIKTCPLGVLSCFLYWPRQDLFLENAVHIWPFLPTRVFGDLLQKMAYRYDKNCFMKFFPDFYQQSPLHLKNYFICGENGAFLFLGKFFDSGDIESIEVMFRNIDAVDRVKIVFQYDILQLFLRAMVKDKWDLVKVCLQEAMLSGEERKRLKEIFPRLVKEGFLRYPLYSSYRAGTNDSGPKLKSFFDFLDEASADEEK